MGKEFDRWSTILNNIGIMENKRMVILVEGESELIFVQQMMIPRLYSVSKDGWSIESCKIISNRKLNKKGGNVNYDYLCNDIGFLSSSQ